MFDNASFVVQFAFLWVRVSSCLLATWTTENCLSMNLLLLWVLPFFPWMLIFSLCKSSFFAFVNIKLVFTVLEILPLNLLSVLLHFSLFAIEIYNVLGSKYACLLIYSFWVCLLNFFSEVFIKTKFFTLMCLVSIFCAWSNMGLCFLLVPHSVLC